MRIFSGLFPILTLVGLVTAPLCPAAPEKKSTSSQASRKSAKPSPASTRKATKSPKTTNSQSSAKRSSSQSTGKPTAASSRERGETVRRAIPLESEPSEPIAPETPAPPPPPPAPQKIDITHPDFRMPPRKGSPKPHGTRQDPPDRRRTRPLDEPKDIPLPGGAKSSLFAAADAGVTP